MVRISKLFLAAGITLSSLHVSAAYAQPANLSIKKDEAYLHTPSGITLPASITGIKLTEGRSYYENDLNISVQYINEAQTDFFSVYVYKVSAGTTGIWFDQSRTSIETRGQFSGAKPVNLEKSALPAGTQQNALRVGYEVGGTEYRSTGLVLGDVNGWMVKIRASSKTRDVAALNEWITAALGEIGWPKADGKERPAALVEPCADTLIFASNAKRVKEDSMVSGLMSSLLTAAVVANEEKQGSEGGKGVSENTSWCRDFQAGTGGSNIYRPNGSKDSYIMPISDAGFSISTGIDGLGGLMADEAKGKKESEVRYSVTLDLPDKKQNYAARTGLPDPNGLMTILNTERPVSELSLNGDKKVTIFAEGK
jgi:hypothetical protein